MPIRPDRAGREGGCMKLYRLRLLPLAAALLLAAIIWGFAFVAQTVGMDHVGPFTF